MATQRLLLRRPRRSDAATIFASYAQDIEVTRYMSWRPHDAVADVEAYVARRMADWRRGAGHAYVIATADAPRQAIGMIDLRARGHAVLFGYVLARAHWGRGYMPEALSALLAWSLAQPAIWRGWAFCDIDNRASARVMEKAGMTREGVLRRWAVHPNLSTEPRDCVSYAKVRDPAH